MRLLHARTLELREFFENATPVYAILSHTWQQQEVTYQDMQGPNAKNKAGYTKIQHCCEQAARDGYEFVWIDTCCIDKTSSAELSEAINSMYQWYKKANVCYAYLADVPPTRTPPPKPKQVLEETIKSQYKQSIEQSRWFTRGWTLQELIAPTEVEFFAKDWSMLGTKSGMSEVLSTVTGIDEATLGGRDLREVSIAKRMSWASKRVTTRTEDIAYCLLGIFGVNLPLLYGEGERAFLRLQEEIMKNSDDQSLFAWEAKPAFDDRPGGDNLTIENNRDFGITLSVSSTVDSDLDLTLNPKIISRTRLSRQTRPLRGFLACSPAEFENSGNIIPYRNWEASMPYSMTNQGLCMEIPVIQYEGYEDFTCILACHFENNFLGPLGIYIRPVASPSGDQFARDASHRNPVIVVPQHVSQAQVRTVYIRQEVLVPTSRDFDRKDHFLIRSLPHEEYTLLEVFPKEYWNESQKILRSPDRIGALLFHNRDEGNDALPFAVIIRSKVLQEGSENENYSCSCSIVVGLFVDEERLDLAKIIEQYSHRIVKSTYSYEDLNPHDRINKERETAFARIGREVFMGQSMFVVDIGVRSIRFKQAPFFALSDTSIKPLDRDIR